MNVPADETGDCDNIPTAPTVTATDNCDISGVSPLLWINEIHYDNVGGDVGEFVEVAGAAGMDVSGAIYSSPIGKINSGPVTTFNEYSIVSENRCYPLPESVPSQQGVLLGCALPTGIGMVNKHAQCCELPQFIV